MARKSSIRVFNRLKNIRGIFNSSRRSRQLVLTGIVLFVTFSLALIVPPKIADTTSNQLNQSPSVAEKGVNSKGDDWGIEWEISFGGDLFSDKGYWVDITSDNGYIITGYSGSYGDILGDVFLVKVFENGTKEWEKNYGGVVHTRDEGFCVQQTSDGGYIVTGNSANKAVWLIKTNANGEKQWDKTYGGTGSDVGRFVVQTSDGGYLIVGETSSFGAGAFDFLIIKTDSFGNVLWSFTYGSTKSECAQCVKKTSDGGYIIVGYSRVNNDFDVILLKIDGNGNFLWVKEWGGDFVDRAYCVVQSGDGGYVIVGNTGSYSAGNGESDDSDVWLIKTDANGNEVWNKTYGGTGYDVGRCVAKSSDGGYIITGYTDSYGVGDNDVWLIKTDENGTEEWSKTFGMTSGDYGYCVSQTSDGGYIIAGTTYSTRHELFGSYDVWLIKVSYGIGDSNESGYLIDNETVRYVVVFGIIGLTVGLVAYLITREVRVEPEEIGE